MSSAPAPLILGLLRPQAFPQPVPPARLIETHISWVIVAGEHAYKIKKPLRLDFLDFSSLQARRFYCQEELRLNRRLAPELYLEVVPITGSLEAPRFGGEGEVLEWAVHMRAFDPQSGLDKLPAVSREQIVAVARQLADFHMRLPPLANPPGNPVQAALDNFSQLRACPGCPPEQQQRLARIEAWTSTQGQRLAGHFEQRQAQGHVRECHGDLHLGNIAWHQGQPLIFDALEFSSGLRSIDTLNECAFLMMDLFQRGWHHQAWRFLNEYLESSGDYAGLPALPYYLVYRAMVRAKVAAIRCAQAGASADEACTYLALAEQLTMPQSPALILMHGPSGSGKSHLAGELMELLGAIRLRSDVERKRLFGLRAEQSSQAITGGIYTPEADQQTRQRLLALSRLLLQSDQRVIVDATFIRRDWREPFIALAGELGVPWCLLSMELPEALLRQRLSQRHGDASEADQGVLEAQLAHHEALDAQEQAHKIRVTQADEAGTLASTICESLSLTLSFKVVP